MADFLNHQHNLTGENVVYVSCEKLEHCPSMCSCPIYDCSAVEKFLNGETFERNDFVVEDDDAIKIDARTYPVTGA